MYSDGTAKLWFAGKTDAKRRILNYPPSSSLRLYNSGSADHQRAEAFRFVSLVPCRLSIQTILQTYIQGYIPAAKLIVITLSKFHSRALYGHHIFPYPPLSDLEYIFRVVYPRFS